ncbi:hypothetical protein KP509_27G026500 [Ceratopteris richardii]|uniref:Centromere/kinetochore protein zw10-like protein n=1 Tax=Ceratopteris richardii TaxID=49495 RepID=A0A8T2RHC9_CERRI|nr:hypothetical protein KP509_27G026500 [Ceratopteris richardii]KAH7294963.1 hypothetical protein KP509_27G026500 [Ceratopteris richardii]KAH7294964.1 hypothetical protein KP509_27G026500 [Ceratopteris richardii]
MADAEGTKAELVNELVHVLGVQSKDAGSWDASALLSASELRALVNRMQLRSEQVKDRVGRCVLSQKSEFSSLIGSASASLNHFSQISQNLEPFLTPSSPSQDPSALCSELPALVDQTRQTNREIREKREAIQVVERITHLHEILKSASFQCSEGKIVEAAQVLIDAQQELGVSGKFLDETHGEAEEDDFQPYVLLRQLWRGTYSEISAHLEELFSSTVMIDANNSRLHVSNRSHLSAVLMAMERIGLLESTFAKLADGIMKAIVNAILRDPLRVELSEATPTAEEAILSWEEIFNKEGDTTLLVTVYTKLLKVVNFLWLHISCNNDLWMNELGRYLWPRMADSIISSYLSKAVPNEVSEVAKFQESADLTIQFERSLNELHFLNDLSASGDKLGKFASEVEVHFVSKKKSRIMKRARRLLVRYDFGSLYDDFKESSIGSDKNGEQNRIELLFQEEKCLISHAAKELMEIVHSALADACVVAAKISFELYHAARDALLLYAAIVPVKLAKELNKLSLEAAVHHNDCLYLAHECLVLKHQYLGVFPSDLKQTFMFVDLFALFQEMADRVLNQQLQLSLENLNKALDVGNGFSRTHEIHPHEMASLSLDQVVMGLEKIRMLWKPVMIGSIYVRSMGYLMTSIFGRLTSEILDIRDLDQRETEQLHELILSLDDRLLPLMLSLVDQRIKDTTSAENISALSEIGRLVPTWCKLLRLAELLNMPSTSIVEAWENGNLALCGFTSIEVQNLLRAMFQDSEKRKESLRRIAAKNFPDCPIVV